MSKEHWGLYRMGKFYLETVIRGGLLQEELKIKCNQPFTD